MTLGSLAVDLLAGMDADPETWWLSLMAFGRAAGELVKRRKGDRLAVMGHLQRSRYRPCDGGESRESWTVLCDAVLGPRSPRLSGGKRPCGEPVAGEWARQDPIGPAPALFHDAAGS